tara:strand:- start:534 stop:869 length:336 start_codon:yes stop_codon:yes gene_type:complete
MSEESSQPEVSSEITITGMEDFFQKIKHSTIQFMHPSIKEFLDKYSVINKGCSCNKKKRIAAARQAYINMVPQIINNVDIEVEMSRMLQSYRVVFNNEDQELGYFGTPRDT